MQKEGCDLFSLFLDLSPSIYYGFAHINMFKGISIFFFVGTTQSSIFTLTQTVDGIPQYFFFITLLHNLFRISIHETLVHNTVDEKHE
jgi:hypothetical protein